MLMKIKIFPATLPFILAFVFIVSAQDILPVNAPSSADIMRERIAKAKAYIVVKNYNAAIYELENIKRESADPALGSVVNVLLMNSFLEQGDYKKAQDFLAVLAKDQKAGKPNAAANYFAVAAQVIRCSRTLLERYNAMGLNVSDRTLPEAAVADVEKMRATLELVVDQSKVMGNDKSYMDSAIALLDGATAARRSFAKDDYDANRWKMESDDAREQMASSRTTIIDAVDISSEPASPKKSTPVSAEPPSAEMNAVLIPVTKDEPVIQKKPAEPPIKKPASETVAALEKPESVQPSSAAAKEPAAAASAEPKRNRLVVRSAPKTPAETAAPSDEPEQVGQTAVPKDTAPMAVGALIGYAIKKANPIYPSVARNMRMTGVVKVEVLLDEDGKVAAVQNTDGPSLLQDAAEDAIRKWKFTPFKRDGEPVKAVGFVSFNFTL